MDVKLFEIRDAATFMPVMAVRLTQRSEPERFLLRRAGYADSQIQEDHRGEPYVILVKLDGVEAQYDPYSWSRSRTLPNAHHYIIQNWFTLRSGDVVDVEYLLGERAEPKESERHGNME